MEPVLPSWFKQRQAKIEAVGDNLYRVSAPNMAEAFIVIRKGDNGLWQPALLQSVGGEELASLPFQYEQSSEAWNVAFELHRVRFMV
jgi:hypothetical protein